MKTSSSGGGCLCFNSRSLSIISGAVSVLCSHSVILVSIYLLINTTAYNLVTRSLSGWLRQHNRDKEVGHLAIALILPPPPSVILYPEEINLTPN